MTFDAQGRLWVAVMPSYPHWKPKTKMDDKILILEDTNGDGKADKCTIFARGLHQPTGFEIGYGGAFIAEQPDIIFARDSSGKNEKADIYERVLFGFDSADSHHGIAAFEWGPGGALYFQEGTFKYSQVESPYGAQRMAEAGVWRFEPRSHRIEAFVSVRFANPWGHVFDRWGQSFIADASPGHNFWATPISGRVIYPYKHPGGTQGRRFKEKRKVPQLLAKRMRPSSGCELVSSRNFPDSAQGNYLLNNVIGFQGVLQHSMKDVDSGFLATEIEPLIYSKDKNFRPVDLQFGPDGALYICDWQNALIGHLQHNLRDPNRDHSHGRIWRITYKGRPLVKPPQIQGAPIAKLLDGLKVYEDRNRYRVRRELAQRDSEKVIAALKTWVANVDKSDKNAPHHQLEALWMYQTHNVVNEPLLKQLLGSSDYRIRAAATRVLSYWHPRISDPLALVKKLVNDKHPRVRLEAVRACSFFTTSKAIEIALESLNHPQDDYLKYTLDETMNTLEKYE